jgi:hypothetical protein
MRRRIGGERGQGTVEWVGAMLLIATILLAIAAALGPRVPGGELARAIAGTMLCAVRAQTRDCDEAAGDPGLREAYGELAAEVRRHAPALLFEGGEFASLPVDFRSCRARSCADSVRVGAIRRSQGNEPPTAFVRVIDCRSAPPPEVDCSGERQGRLYLQYWFYYPDSATRPWGRSGYHLDDWESLQVRIDADGTARSRASSHHGYNGRRPGPLGGLSDAGVIVRPAWDEPTGLLHVAAGSHAGRTAPRPGDPRGVRRRELRLVPLEPIAAGPAGGDAFAITPPWRKPVWRDPESPDT